MYCYTCITIKITQCIFNATGLFLYAFTYPIIAGSHDSQLELNVSDIFLIKDIIQF